MRKCENSAMMTLATMAIGTSGGFDVITALAQSGACPPGAGSSRMASPLQTKLMPSVTTMDGRSRMWMSTPRPA